MATITREQIAPYRTLDGRPFPVAFFPEATSQSVPAGRFIRQVCDLSSGRVRKAGGIALDVTLPASTTVLGVMADPFTNRTATSNNKTDQLGVFVASPNVVFKANVATTTSNQSLTAAMVGSSYGLVNLGSSGSSGVWCVNFNNTSNTYVKVIGLIDEVADVNGAVEIVFENDKVLLGD